MLDVRAGRVEVIAVLRLDRAFRHVIDTLATLMELGDFGTGFVSVREPIDTTTPMGRFALTMMAAIAQLEREMVSVRVREGLDRARAQGKRLGRPPGSKDPYQRARHGR